MEEAVQKSKPINRDMIKYLAIIPMVIGHLCAYLWSEFASDEKPLIVFILENLSLFAPPVFFFFIAEGFRHTHSRVKYALRLFIFAFINQIPFCLINNGTLLTEQLFLNWSIIFTLFLGLLALIVCDSKWKLPIRIIVIVLIDALTLVLSSEWTVFGIAIILGYHIFCDKPRVRFIWFCVMVLGMEALPYMIMGINIFNAVTRKFGIYMLVGSLMQIAVMVLSYFLVTKCYNGKKGKHPVFAKWFFYILYPLHLWVIYFVQLMMA